MVVLYLAFLLLVAAQRLTELAISRRNAQDAFGQGGVEFGQRHLPFMKLLHGVFLVACAAEVLLLHRPFHAAIGVPMFLAAVLAQVLRHAAIYALGPAWNIRVIVVPERPAVDSGVYRFVRHPNYVAVVVEGFAVPLIHGAWLTALAFSVLNAILLAVRIRCEETALTTHCGYGPLMEGRGRFVPWSLARSSSTHGL